MDKMSLQGKIIILVCSVVLLALTATNWLISARIAEDITQQTGRTVMYVARTVACSHVVPEGLADIRDQQVGKIMPYTLIGYIQVTISLLVGILAFDLPFRGSLALLYGLSSLYIFTSLSLGILISTIAKTKLQALLLSIGVIYLSLLLSGFMVPRAAMPIFFQTLGNIIPLTFYLEILRGVLLNSTFSPQRRQVRLDIAG